MRTLYWISFAVLSLAFPCFANAENWISTGVQDAEGRISEYDKDRVSKTAKPDMFAIWLRRNGMERRGGERITGRLYNYEVDCRSKQLRSLGVWLVLENKNLEKVPRSEDYEPDPFGLLDEFFRSTICSNSR